MKRRGLQKRHLQLIENEGDRMHGKMLLTQRTQRRRGHGVHGGGGQGHTGGGRESSVRLSHGRVAWKLYFVKY
jgi:hypothetical protein